MLLRASGELRGEAPEVRAVTDASAARASGVPGGEALLEYADAVVGGDPDAIARARETVRAGLGGAALVDAAGVIGNFSRMVRIADGTGIPLDTPVAIMSTRLREELGLDAYGSAANTKPIRGVARLLARAAQPFLRLAMKRFAGRPGASPERNP